MEGKIEKASACFKEGFSCSQAVLAAYCEDFGLDRDTAMKVACGFGAGMGRLGGTCGAVTGAYMVIGLKYGKFRAEDAEAKEKTYELVREFDRMFRERHGATACRELIGVSFADGDPDVIAEKLATCCPGYVEDAADILADILCD